MELQEGFPIKHRQIQSKIQAIYELFFVKNSRFYKKWSQIQIDPLHPASPEIEQGIYKQLGDWVVCIVFVEIIFPIVQMYSTDADWTIGHIW